MKSQAPNIGKKTRATQGTQKCTAMLVWFENGPGEKRYGTGWASSASDPPNPAQTRHNRPRERESRGKIRHRDHAQGCLQHIQWTRGGKPLYYAPFKARARDGGFVGSCAGAKPARICPATPVETSTASSIPNTGMLPLINDKALAMCCIVLKNYTMNQKE